MTYNESFALALKLKNFVSLCDEEAVICLYFTSETDFELKIFEKDPDPQLSMDLGHEAFYVKKLPQAWIGFCKHSNRITYLYRDPNLNMQMDHYTNEILEFDGEESTPIDLEAARKSFRELLLKLK